MSRNQNANDVANDLGDFVNGGSMMEMREFVEFVTTRVHRTLQQRIMQLFMFLVAEWASKNENQYDLRNEATVKLAKKIMQATEPYERSLPLI